MFESDSKPVSVLDMPMSDQPMIVASPLGVEILVYRQADGSCYADGWKAFFFV